MILGTETRNYRAKFQKIHAASYVVFSSNGVVFCVHASCWIESKINMTKKLKNLQIFYYDIHFASNDFIPQTVRNYNTFFIQNMIKESEYFCNSLNLLNSTAKQFLLGFEHKVISNTYFEGDLEKLEKIRFCKIIHPSFFSVIFLLFSVLSPKPNILIV